MNDSRVTHIGSPEHVARAYAGMIEDRLSGLSSFNKNAALSALNREVTQAVGKGARPVPFATPEALGMTMVENTISPAKAVEMINRAKESIGPVSADVREAARQSSRSAQPSRGHQTEQRSRQFQR